MMVYDLFRMRSAPGNSARACLPDPWPQYAGRKPRRKPRHLQDSGIKREGPMLGLLFRRLTAEPARGPALFAAAVEVARRPYWYREGAVPDTLDGRFAMLATIAALILVRLERDGDEGNAVSVGLTERFIEVMEDEHRELGLGDPALGRTVRKLVGSLARRTALWREAIDGRHYWADAAAESVYKGETAAEAANHVAVALQS